MCALNWPAVATITYEAPTKWVSLSSKRQIPHCSFRCRGKDVHLWEVMESVPSWLAVEYAAPAVCTMYIPQHVKEEKIKLRLSVRLRSLNFMREIVSGTRQEGIAFRCVWERGYKCALVCVWRSEDNIKNSVSSSIWVPRNQTQGVRLEWQVHLPTETPVSSSGCILRTAFGASVEFSALPLFWMMSSLEKRHALAGKELYFCGKRMCRTEF